MTTYSIVDFFEDNSVEAVPTIWINKDEGTCAWSKQKSPISKLKGKKSTPNDIEYDYFKLRVVITNIGK